MTMALRPPHFETTIEAALWWVRVVPVVPVSRKLADGPRPMLRWKEDGPLRTAEEVREFWHRNPTAQVAMVLGKTSIVADVSITAPGINAATPGTNVCMMLGAIDTDIKNWTAGMAEPPAGFVGMYRHATKSGGTHDLFLYKVSTPEAVKRRAIGVGGFVDVLLEGLLVVPPTHFDGTSEYRVVREGEIPEFESVGLALDQAAPWLRSAWKAHRPPKEAAAGEPDDKAPIREGARRSTLLSRAGRMRDIGVSGDAILTDLREFNARRCEPPLADSELQALSADVARRYKPTREPMPAPHAEVGSSYAAAPDVLVEIARSKADLFHDEEGELYATVTRPYGGQETYRLRSAEFRRWLGREFYLQRGKAPPGEAMKAARETIEAFADFDGAERTVALRVGYADGCLFIDLGDDSHRAVRVSPSGWEIVREPPVRFVRGRGMAALPIPEPGGSIQELLPFFNAQETTDPHFVLSVAYVLGAFHPWGPYAILAINGEQGSGKSFATVRVKSLCDPSNPSHRSAPKEPRDLAVAGRNSRVLAFDNLSGIPDWLSDAICRLSTGGGFATRSLYTDDEETIFSGKRPVVFNGIVPIAAAADLRDRCLLVTWPTMKGAKMERELAPAFEAVRPRVFGAILDALVRALASYEAISGEYAGRLPRMGDFFAWVRAAEPALPWPPGTFERVFADSRAAGSEIAVSESPLALALRAFLEARGASAPFEGTATALLAALRDYATPPISPEARAPEGWPKSPSALSSKLRTMAPDLRASGVAVEFPENGTHKRRLFRVCLRPDDRREASPPTPPRPLTVEEWEGRVGGGPGAAFDPGAAPMAPSAQDTPQPAAGGGGGGEPRPFSTAEVADNRAEPGSGVEGLVRPSSASARSGPLPGESSP
jgi:hypothetical protein